MRNVSVLLAFGVVTDGYRHILGVAEGEKEDLEGWRGLKGAQLIALDACRGLVEAAVELFPAAQWQRCTVHWNRNEFARVPNNKFAEVARRLVRPKRPPELLGRSDSARSWRFKFQYVRARTCAGSRHASPAQLLEKPI